MVASVDNYTIGRGICYFRKMTATPTDWAATTGYGPGAYVNNGDYLWTTVSGGTSSTGAGPTGSTGTFSDGTVTWTAVAWDDLGNCPSFRWATEVETLEHFSSRSGIKTRDKKVILSRKGTLTIVLDEITTENLTTALMGTETGGTITVFNADQVEGQIKLVGSNTVGNKFSWFFGNVAFQPGKEISVIGDDWMQIEMEAEVNQHGNGTFGTVTELA